MEKGYKYLRQPLLYYLYSRLTHSHFNAATLLAQTIDLFPYFILLAHVFALVALNRSLAASLPSIAVPLVIVVLLPPQPYATLLPFSASFLLLEPSPSFQYITTHSWAYKMII